MMCKGLNDETSCLDILDSNHQGSIPRPVTTEYGIPTAGSSSEVGKQASN